MNSNSSWGLPRLRLVITVNESKGKADKSKSEQIKIQTGANPDLLGIGIKLLGLAPAVN